MALLMASVACDSDTPGGKLKLMLEVETPLDWQWILTLRLTPDSPPHQNRAVDFLGGEHWVELSELAFDAGRRLAGP
jgi:hypothetical protein